jgi:hypothetical protein
MAEAAVEVEVLLVGSDSGFFEGSSISSLLQIDKSSPFLLVSVSSRRQIGQKNDIP